MSTESQTQQTRIPNGSGGAAVLAAGMGACIFGLVVAVAEASSAVAETLNLIHPVGPLSGKVAVAIVSWLVSWGVFEKLWGGREINFGKVRFAAWTMVFVGFALTFPPVFALFAD